jgi:hypothetical protein
MGHLGVARPLCSPNHFDHMFFYGKLGAFRYFSIILIRNDIKKLIELLHGKFHKLGCDTLSILKHWRQNNNKKNCTTLEA